jgi:hypothetical protein
MPEEDFTKIQNIFKMFSPGTEISERTINPGSRSKIIERLQNILINTSGGVFSVERLKFHLEGLYKNANEDEHRELNRYFSFYSTLGNISQVEGGNSGALPKGAYYWTSENGNKKDKIINFQQILGLENTQVIKPTSIIMSRTPYVSPATKDIAYTETFLNFMPNIVMSRCVPYLDVEFIFDRPIGGDEFISTAGLYKFLLGGKNTKDLSDIDKGIHQARAKRFTTERNTVKDNPPLEERSYYSAGMEMFTSPQTLLNLTEENRNQNRYIGVLDPMRPFATIESVAIEVKGTVGVMCHKTAQLSLTLHDRSRLSEIADLIQPTVYGRTTIWLTYGWRHPIDNDDNEASTYAEFINKKLLMREAYGISGSTLSFETSGQVKISLKLYTKCITEMKQATLAEDQEFVRLIREQEKLAKEIKEIKQRYGLEQPEGISKEIRAYTIINDAANGNGLPDMKPEEVAASINRLKASLRTYNKNIPRAVQDELVGKLNKFFFGNSTTKKEFDFKSKSKANAISFISSKIDELNGPDPFLPHQEKMDQLMIDFFGSKEAGIYPPLQEIKLASNASIAAQNKDVQAIIKANGKRLKSNLVSFGKLFSVFVLPSVYMMDFVDECQVFFYNINDYAGLASGINIAEFPIDLPEFLRQYNEQIATNATVNMKIEQFVQIAVNSQIADLRGVPYGFRSKHKEYFAEWKADSPNAELTDKTEEKFAARSLEVNDGRGGFQLPQIEVIVEMTSAVDAASPTTGAPSPPADDRDALRKNSDTGLNAFESSSKNKIIRIHIFDKCQNPYSDAAKIIASDTGNGTAFSMQFENFNPFTAKKNAPKDEKGNVVELTESQKYERGFVKRNYKFSLNDSANNRDTIRKNIALLVPTLIPGMNSSAITECSVSSQGDALQASAQMLGANMGKNTAVGHRGDGLPGLPLRVVPTTLSLRTLGCPLLSFAQMFFVDMNSGTTIDNIYGITSLSHNITPGKFETSINMTPYDAYGKYESARTILDEIKSASASQ